MIVPIWRKEEEKAAVFDAGEDVRRKLAAGGVRVKLDASEQRTPGWKFNFWEMKVREGGGLAHGLPAADDHLLPTETLMSVASFLCISSAKKPAPLHEREGLTHALFSICCKRASARRVCRSASRSGRGT